jgi:hypothetical protein
MPESDESTAPPASPGTAATQASTEDPLVLAKRRARRR